MKKYFFIVLLILSSCSENIQSEPSLDTKQVYETVESYSWVTFKQNVTKDVSILDIDLTKAWISFWWVKIWDQRTLNQDYDEFQRLSLDEANQIVWTSIPWKPIGLINGQFFTHIEDMTLLSFPVKSDWKVLSSYIDNELQKRTIQITKSNKIFVQEWYSDDILNDPFNLEVIVWINPIEDFIASKEVWRSYVGVLDEKHVAFFIAKEKNQAQMKQILSDYGVQERNMVMLDWWPSAQFSYSWQIIQKGWWKVPQYNVIYTR